MFSFFRNSRLPQMFNVLSPWVSLRVRMTGEGLRGRRGQVEEFGQEEGRALPEASSSIWNGLSLQSRHAVISRALACLGAITAYFLQGAL